MWGHLEQISVHGMCLLSPGKQFYFFFFFAVWSTAICVWASGILPHVSFWEICALCKYISTAKTKRVHFSVKILDHLHSKILAVLKTLVWFLCLTHVYNCLSPEHFLCFLFCLSLFLILNKDFKNSLRQFLPNFQVFAIDELLDKKMP